MNIVILNDYAYINGGAGKVALTSAVALAKEGYQVILFSAVGPSAPFLENVCNLKVICLDQYDILNDPKRWRAILNGIWNKKAANKLGEILDTLNINDTIIHVHACAKALSTSCIRIVLKKRFKLVFHIHDYGLSCPNMGFFNYPIQQICKIKPLSFQCIKTNCDSRSYAHKLWRCLRQFVQIKWGGLPNGISCFIYISKFSYLILQEFLPDKSKHYLVSNPIDITKNDIVKADKNKNYVFIGRLTPEKNPNLFAKIANKLHINAVFIGSGPCEKMIKEIYPNAKITGWIDSEKINEYLHEARALVFPSAWYEVQPLAVLEATGRGIPVIVSDICAGQESFINGRSGLLIKNNDEKSLEDALLKMQNDEVVRNMGIYAYNDFWENRKDMDAYIKNMINIYKEIL